MDSLEKSIILVDYAYYSSGTVESVSFGRFKSVNIADLWEPGFSTDGNVLLTNNNLEIKFNSRIRITSYTPLITQL